MAFSMARAGSLVLALLSAFFSCLGCRRDAPEGGKPPPAQQAAPAQAEDEPAQPTARLRCPRLSGSSELLLGAGVGGGGKPAEIVELGAAAYGEGVFLLGTLSRGAETHARVAWLESAGVARWLDLGRVFGPVDPPRVAAAGPFRVALLVDGDPSGLSLRIVGFDTSGGTVTQRLGPEVHKGRGDTLGADIGVSHSGRGLLVWDRPRARGGTEILGLPFDARSLAELGPARPLVPPEHDAESPLVVGGARGFWLLWLSSSEATGGSERGPWRGAGHPGAADTWGVVEDPPLRLWVRPIDETGRPLADALELSAGPEVALLFSALELAPGRLLVAYRRAPSSHVADAEPAVLVRVESDGSLRRQSVSAGGELGPGAPTLLAHPRDPTPLLVLEGAAQGAFLGSVGEAGDVALREEAGLAGSVVLASGAGGLLVASPRGGGFDLGIVSCPGL